MGVIGIEELFLRVRDLERAVAFYTEVVGLALDAHDDERAYLQAERGHLVLQVDGSSGRHQGGGPLHFALTVTEDAFDDIAARVAAGGFTSRGPITMEPPRRGRALFVFDPDGNEAEVNTRYLYPGVPLRG
jgi:catechol 2,3-dioxygenase-like lactoylglutathione lyase family enzyme